LLRGFSEVGTGLSRGASCTLLGKQRTRRPMNSEEARIVAEEQPPTNNCVPEEAPARQDVDVLLDVSELEVDKIRLTVRDLRAHVSVLAELASLVNLQIGVDARLDLDELEIEGTSPRPRPEATAINQTVSQRGRVNGRHVSKSRYHSKTNHCVRDCSGQAHQYRRVWRIDRPSLFG
jgi:hypothetical protein